MIGKDPTPFARFRRVGVAEALAAFGVVLDAH
jgi:hypothetical protein